MLSAPYLMMLTVDGMRVGRTKWNTERLMRASRLRELVSKLNRSLHVRIS